MSGSFLLVREPVELLFGLLDVGRQTLGIDPQLAGRLVDEVHRLVRQVTVGDIPVAQPGCRLQGGIVDLHLVMGLVTGTEDAQNFDRLLHRRFLQIDRLEAAFQCGVLLDVLPVLAQRSSADALKLTTRQGRFEKVAGVEASLGGAGAHHGVNFVEEQHHFALSLLDFVYHRLEALLELAPELGTGHHSAHVQGQHPAAPERVGHVVGDDPGRQALGYGGLAHAGFADDNRVVLLAPGQRLHHLPDFIVAANNGVELPGPGQVGQVYGVPCQRAVVALGPGVVHPAAAADFHKRLIQPFLVDTELLDHLGRIALRFHDGGDE